MPLVSLKKDCLPRRRADLQLKIVQTTIYAYFVLHGHSEFIKCEVDPESIKIKTEKHKQDQFSVLCEPWWMGTY